MADVQNARRYESQMREHSNMTAMRSLKDSESKQIIKDFEAQHPSSTEYLNSIKNTQAAKVEDVEVFYTGGKPWILRINDHLFPSLKFDAIIGTLPKVVVDMGAIPHIVNGAPIMRPGIRRIEGDFKQNDLVTIQDEKHLKTIALGIAELDSEAMRSATKGRVIKNLHYVGDKIWTSFSSQK